MSERTGNSSVCFFRSCERIDTHPFLNQTFDLWLCVEHEDEVIEWVWRAIGEMSWELWQKQRREEASIRQPQPLTADKPAVQYDKGRLAKNECPFCAVSFDGWQVTRVVMHIFECLLKDYEARMAALERR